MTGRLIDPIRDIERASNAQHGVLTQREIVDRQEQSDKLNAEPDRSQNFITQETLSVYSYNVAANASDTMSFILPDSISTFYMSGASFPVGGQCRLLSARVASNGSPAAGSAMPQFTVFEEGAFTFYPIPDLTLTTGVHAAAVRWDWDNAIQLSSEASWTWQINTDVAYSPTTLDYWVAFTLGYGEWSN